MQKTDRPLVDLREAAGRPITEVGSKARTLGRLAAGHPVPEGMVLGSELAGASEARLRAALVEVVGRLGDGPLAVRSSAAAEDLPGRSYAGLYETVLGVEGVEELEQAVRRCRDSARSDRVLAYHGGEPPRMAVLVQKMVPSEAAGVAFTADPVTGERDVTVVEAVRGLGERLVSGEASPDEWEVRQGEVTVRTRTEGALDGEQVREVAGLAGRVADELGAPQDIEWAFAEGRLHLLQARPITGLPEVEPVEPEFTPLGEGFWMLDGGHYPSPVSPMGASFYLPALEEQGSAAFRDWGLLLDRIRQGVVGWRVYVHIDPPPDEEAFGRQLARAQDVFEGGRMEEVVRRWWDEWRPEFRERIDKLASTDLGSLDDEELIAHLRRAIELVEHGQRVHFELFPPYMLAVAEAVRFCVERLGWSKARATELVAGLSEASSEPARRLHELAALARTRPRTDELLESGEPVGLDELRSSDDDFAEALDAYLAEFGMRATAYDVIALTVGEQEEALVAAIRGGGDYDPAAVAERHAETRARTVEEAHAQLADDEEALSRFEELLERLERVFPVREDNIFFTDNAPVGLVRLAALEVGRRLTARGLMEDPEHVVFLTVEEAVESLTGGRDHRQKVTRRRGERVWAETHAPAPMYGEPTPPPDPSGLPESAARLMGAMGFFMENDLAAPVGDGLAGTAASPGTYTGPVRVVRGEAEFGKVRTGDVLVCPITTPAWSVLFGRIGALVTDTGGLLSHAAIVAREHGIPAVVATGSATGRLQDGQTVTVDGAAGRIGVREEQTEGKE